MGSTRDMPLTWHPQLTPSFYPPYFFESSLSPSSTSPSLPPTYFSLSLLQNSSTNNLLPQSSSSQLRLCCHSCCTSSPARNETSIMAEYDTVPREAAPQEVDDKQEALEEPGVDQRTEGQEDTSEQPPRDREDPISSSKDETSGTDERIIRRPPLPPPYYDCRDVGCIWPCAHHFHPGKNLYFRWYPELEKSHYHHPERPRIQSGMKECQFCRVFFGIGQGTCGCGANARNDCHDLSYRKVYRRYGRRFYTKEKKKRESLRSVVPFCPFGGTGTCHLGIGRCGRYDRYRPGYGAAIVTMITSQKAVVVAANIRSVIFDRMGSSPVCTCHGHAVLPSTSLGCRQVRWSGHSTAILMKLF